jgi:tetratricopeptide (TPR) repeat protein
LRHDPDYAAAYSGLASAYLNLAANQNYSTADANRRARAAATRALSLDPSLADAHAAIGLVLLFADWDWDGSARAVARALEINPNHAGAHLQRAWWLAFRGRGREAIQENARAWELDPLSPATGGFYAYTLYWSGEMERAVTQSRHVLDLDPNSAFAHQVLGLSLFALGDGHGARRELDTAVALFPQHAFLVACRGWIYAHTGGTDEAILAVSALDALADNGGPGSAPEIVGTAAAGLAMLHGALGDLNTAVERLLLAERLRSSYVLAMHVYPGLRALCRDERVAALATRVGLPPTKASS